MRDLRRDEAAILSLEQKKAPGSGRRAPKASAASAASSSAPKRKPARTGAWVQKAFMALGCPALSWVMVLLATWNVGDKDDSDESEEEDASRPARAEALCGRSTRSVAAADAVTAATLKVKLAGVRGLAGVSSSGLLFPVPSLRQAIAKKIDHIHND
ncbi:hypothetical protein AK812_SmicGene35008 [Symbiodinium microadriaticum]|uniref:Uncharacterized protein n=1 Tax=Symbiodinium microadriaticum TaxID=2951 RepID=A0A1Q9CMP3_SYMMI|nr:hypothetical protein AK812_SmicGene35008 [Symbiodinium microadriaticum]